MCFSVKPKQSDGRRYASKQMTAAAASLTSSADFAAHFSAICSTSSNWMGRRLVAGSMRSQPFGACLERGMAVLRVGHPLDFASPTSMYLAASLDPPARNNFPK